MTAMTTTKTARRFYRRTSRSWRNEMKRCAFCAAMAAAEFGAALILIGREPLHYGGEALALIALPLITIYVLRASERYDSIRSWLRAVINLEA